MMALKTLARYGGRTRELGNDQYIDLPNMRRHTARPLLVDVHVNLNIVLLEPVADVAH